MTAACGELTDLPVRGRAGRFLCVLALVLPVPLFAALGLSLPLPATVERIAAKLVPFADSRRLAEGASGSIALAPGEAPAGAETAAFAPHASAKGRAEIHAGHGPAHAAAAVVQPGPRTGEVNEAGAGTPATEAEGTPAPPPTQQNASDSGPTPSTGGGSSGGSQTGGSSDPGGSQPVETVTNTANGAVETVNTTVGDTTEAVDETTKGAVDSATSAGSGALGGIKPP